MKSLLRHKEKIFGLVITAIFIILICKNLDLRKLLETFEIFNIKVLLFFIPLYIISLYLRGIRWKYLLYNLKQFTFKEAFYLFTAGSALNAYLPARAGDFWRAYHAGNKLKTSKAKILGSIFFERILDGISVLIILAAAVILYCKQQWVLNLTYLATVLFTGSLAVAFLTVKLNKTHAVFNFLCSRKSLSKVTKLLRKAEDLIVSFLDGFESFNNLRYFMYAFVLSCLAWGIECIVTYLLICGFGFHFGFSISMFVISFLALSTIIPSSSIFVGPYQYAYILALGIYGIEKSNALGIAFIHQIAIMLIITVISIIYFTLTNTNINDIKDEMDNIRQTEREN